MTLPDIIKKEISVDASRETVWAALTEGPRIGLWFGNGQPTRIDLRPGGRIVFDHPGHGDIPADIEQVDAPRTLVYRWAVIGDVGELPVPGNSTVVRVELQGVENKTTVTVLESGFAGLRAPEKEIDARYNANYAGWDRTLQQLADYVAGPDQ